MNKNNSQEEYLIKGKVLHHEIQNDKKELANLKLKRLQDKVLDDVNDNSIQARFNRLKNKVETTDSDIAALNEKIFKKSMELDNIAKQLLSSGLCLKY